MEPLLTLIILPAAPGAVASLADTLRTASVRGDSLGECEIIISRVGGAPECRLDQISNLKCLDSPDLATARQAAIGHARGRYVMFLRAGDRIMANLGETLASTAILEANADLIVAACLVRSPDGSYRISRPLEQHQLEPNPAKCISRFLIKHQLPLQDGQVLVKLAVAAKYRASPGYDDYVHFGCHLLARAQSLRTVQFPVALVAERNGFVGAVRDIKRIAEEVFARNGASGGAFPSSLRHKFIAAVLVGQARQSWRQAPLNALMKMMLALRYWPKARVFSSSAALP